MEVASFLASFLEHEFHTIHEVWIEKIAKKYDLDAEELKKEFLSPLTIQSNEGTQIIITKKKGREPPKANERCTARIWNKGLGGQCTRKLIKDGLCYQHCKELEKNKQLRHGYYQDKPPMNVFTGKHNTIYV